MVSVVFRPLCKEARNGPHQLRNQKLHDLHCSWWQISVMKSRVRQTAHAVDFIKSCTILFGNPEGKIRLRRLIFRRKDNIKTDISPLNAELNPICHLPALVGAHHILRVSRIRVKGCNLWGYGLDPSGWRQRIILCLFCVLTFWRRIFFKF